MITTDDLVKVTNFETLVKVLRDQLDWPIPDDYEFGDVTYEYEAKELGLKADQIAKIREVHQLRPLTTNQPWGIFFVSFEDKGLPVTVMRRILRSLVLTKRAEAKDANRAAWQRNDLLFISAHGKGGARQLSFAHFADGKETGDLPVLRVLNWNRDDTISHNQYVTEMLNKRLHWPEDPKNLLAWRASWASAFEIGYQETIRTAKDMSVSLAALARQIRKRANELLSAEAESGSMRQLHKAFRENLIKDLSEDDFADMFAQTISYGLLAARISRPAGLVVDNLADMIPPTNPFLKELFATFLKLGGRDKRKDMDFDELGVRDVVDMLNRANMEAVLRDFGDKNPTEDPVIHFYELFLKEYDPKKRLQRGVFYTPRPVVNFIVRGIDEILRTEFGLPLGVADISTWAEVAARNKGIKIPSHVKPDSPFVQMLDPATGTGTFLVELIDLIHKRMDDLWTNQGKTAAQRKAAWNAYVPAHLLPRLTAFELMMAPYAIAHMKVGLKLSETGYTFGSQQRARIFLTNALEPARDLDVEFSFISEALAHEAVASNSAKLNAAFVVVVGNPPYATLSSNGGSFIRTLMKDYKKSLGGEIQVQALSNDYAKFMRIAEYFRDMLGVGVIGYITDNSYLDGLLFRDVRRRLIFETNGANIFDLGGNNRRQGDVGEDEGVFDIRQGTAVIFTSKMPSTESRKPQLCRLVGARGQKYAALSNLSLGNATFVEYSEPSAGLPPAGVNDDALEVSVPISEIFSAGKRGARKLAFFGACIATRHDGFAISFSAKEQEDKLRDFMDPTNTESVLRDRYGLCSTAHFNFGLARGVGFDEGRKSIKRVLYRPFDWRVMAYHNRLVGEFRDDIFKNIDASHIALLTTRRVTGGGFTHSLAADGLCEYKAGTHDRNTQVFPLFIKGSDDRLSQDPTRPNINGDYALSLSKTVGMDYEDGIPRGVQKSFGSDFQSRKAEQLGLLDVAWDGRGDLAKTFGPRDLFDYIYAVLHSPSYRIRYADSLQSDFPRIPTPKGRAFFCALVKLGRMLVSLHLLRPEEASILTSPNIRFVGTGEARVMASFPRLEKGKVMINASRWFEDVSRETWDFKIGGYQVLEKWLKDRAATGGQNPSPGRVLTEEDILHYRRVVVALTETRRLMTEIDRVIDQCGGWPGAFAQPEKGA